MNAADWIHNRRVLPRPLRKTTPCKIVCKATGLDIQTRSGKRVWPSIGAAKCAIRNDLEAYRTNSDSLFKSILELVEFKPL